jgi:threonine synthase
LKNELPDPVISLACAHPAKFPETIQKAIGIKPELPPALATLLQNQERTSLLPATIQAVEKFIAEHVTL